MPNAMIRWAMIVFVFSGAAPTVAAEVPTAAAQREDAQPPQFIMVRLRGIGVRQIFAGMIVHATADELDRFDDVAQHYGVAMKRVPNGKKVESTAFFLVQHLNPQAVYDLFRQARSGALGQLQIEAMIIAPETMRPGVKPSDIIHVVPAEELELP